jgi:hypothetical protein
MASGRYASWRFNRSRPPRPDRLPAGNPGTGSDPAGPDWWREARGDLLPAHTTNQMRRAIGPWSLTSPASMRQKRTCRLPFCWPAGSTASEGTASPLTCIMPRQVSPLFVRKVWTGCQRIFGPRADNSAYIAWEVTRTPPLMASSHRQDQCGKRLLLGWQVVEAAGALRVGTRGDPL